MDDRFRILPGVGSPGPSPQPAERGRGGAGPGGGVFAEILERRIGALRFSRHAQERMASRGITMSGAELARLGQALSQVEAKGGRDSLVLLDDKALVVSVKNQTVVTVVERAGLRENVFTNIDSAVIA